MKIRKHFVLEIRNKRKEKILPEMVGFFYIMIDMIPINDIISS